MNCPKCGERAVVLQTFDYGEYVVRVRGHRSSKECAARIKSIERFAVQDPKKGIEGAQNAILELGGIISQLNDVDLRIKRALGMDMLVYLIDTDDDDGGLFRANE